MWGRKWKNDLKVILPLQHRSTTVVRVLKKCAPINSRGRLQIASFTLLFLDQYEHPFADSLGSVGRVSGVSAAPSIGQIGSHCFGLFTRGLPGGFHFPSAKS